MTRLGNPRPTRSVILSYKARRLWRGFGVIYVASFEALLYGEKAKAFFFLLLLEKF